MQERRVGHSGLRVSRLGLGTMSFGSAVDEIDAEEQLTAFLDAGGTLVCFCCSFSRTSSLTSGSETMRLKRAISRLHRAILDA